MWTINFGFRSTALIFCFKFGHILVLFCTFLGPLGLYFGPLGLLLELRSGSKTFFGAYQCSQSILVLEVQPYLFVLNSAKFGAIFAFFGPFGAFLGVGVMFKNFFVTFLYRQ